MVAVRNSHLQVVERCCEENKERRKGKLQLYRGVGKLCKCEMQFSCKNHMNTHAKIEIGCMVEN
jgi:hypothetical protein